MNRRYGVSDDSSAWPKQLCADKPTDERRRKLATAADLHNRAEFGLQAVEVIFLSLHVCDYLILQSSRFPQPHWQSNTHTQYQLSLAIPRQHTRHWGHILLTFWKDPWKISCPRKGCAFSKLLCRNLEKFRNVFRMAQALSLEKSCVIITNFYRWHNFFEIPLSFETKKNIWKMTLKSFSRFQKCGSWFFSPAASISHTDNL